MAGGSDDAVWRSELSQRLEAYRAKRRKVRPNESQSTFSFENDAVTPAAGRAAVAEQEERPEEESFSFTIAIGRPGPGREQDQRQMIIDVSEPATPGDNASVTGAVASQAKPRLYPAASIEERRIAALIDTVCLLFSYGGFLTLFGSLGGDFTLSKLSAAVYALTLAIVYLQYFALFTVFGGTTPGMMLRGLHIVSFSGEAPTPRQMLQRSAGYLLSGGTFFLGFLWAMWDEDELTWHDRISRTYIGSAESLADAEAHGLSHSH